jgi:uncharacterized protein YpiB (UPF0302 family)
VIDSELGTDYRLEYSVFVDTGSDKNKPLTISLPNSPKQNYPNGKGKKDTINSMDLFGYDLNLNPTYTFEILLKGIAIDWQGQQDML